MNSLALFNLSGFELIPLTAIIAPFVFVIFASGFGMMQDYQKRKLQHETIRLAIEKGQPIPPSLLLEKEAEQPKANDRKAAIVLMSVALGIFLTCFGLSSTFRSLDIALGAQITGALQYLGLIPGLIGAGLLLNWYLEQQGKQKNKQN